METRGDVAVQFSQQTTVSVIERVVEPSDLSDIQIHLSSFLSTVSRTRAFVLMALSALVLLT